MKASSLYDEQTRHCETQCIETGILPVLNKWEIHYLIYYSWIGENKNAYRIMDRRKTDCESGK